MKGSFVLFSLILPVVTVLAGCKMADIQPDRIWAVILEQNFYPAGYTPLDVNYYNTNSITRTLENAGVEGDHLLIIREGVNRTDMEKAVTWLKERAEKNETALFYIFAHGPYLEEEVGFSAWFPGQWERLDVEQKILIVDTCFAGLYLTPFREMEPDPGFLIGSSGAKEVAWCGLEEEGLPVLGSTWLHFFLTALTDPASDINGDRYVALQEVFASSIEPLQDYMLDTVYAVPEFLEGIHQFGIYPERMEGYPNPVFYSREEKPLLLYEIKENKQ